MVLSRNRSSRLARTLVATVVSVLALGALQVVPAAADTRPTDPTDPASPETVSADALPTAQINGVAWSQVVVGNTVYVGGQFSTARPAGAAAGTSEVGRSNLLAYDIRTGTLISSWAPSTNAQVLTVTASPDGSRIYVGGDFTQVNGTTRNRIAALDPTTGALVGSFQPRSDSKVRAIAATNSTVYFGGLTSNVSGVGRTRVAAVRASDGALLPWAPQLAGGSIHALAISPDGGKVALGGSFTTLNGSDNPGYGFGAVDATTGASSPWAVNGLIRNGGPNSAITSLAVKGDYIYASGYHFGAGGNLEGIVKATWDGGVIDWVEDCHGDTYSVFPRGKVVYGASHAHYCGNVPKGFPQSDPWTMWFGNAFSDARTGTLGREQHGYYNYEGTPAPTLLHWYPLFVQGTVTGQGQAGWSITGNDDYVVMGGEFPRVNGTGQQGLVRFAVRSKAPNTVGPVLTGSKFNPTLTSFARGTVRVAWQANWDRDNENLTYQVIRDGDTARPVYETKAASKEWDRPSMGFLDTGLVPGQSYRYRVFATDPFGNIARSDTVTITAAESGELSTYAKRVIDDGAQNYWRLGEDSGSAVYDWAGFTDATAQSGVTRGESGAIGGDANRASRFNGSGDGLVVSNAQQVAPDTFTTEAWVRTTSTSGGKIVGFGGSATGNSGNYDRHTYMDNEGRITFGVYPGSVRTLTSSPGYNDGQWHQVVSSMGPDGMTLWIDGRKVGNRSDTTTGQPFTGNWRVGGDNIGGWPYVGNSFYLDGTIDDVAVYGKVLSPTDVRAHYVSSGRELPGATAPADAYGKAVYGAEPDLYWRLGDTSGDTAADASPNQNPGAYSGGVARGQGSGIGVDGDSSVRLDGDRGAVASQRTFNNPTTYSEEMWFKTSTNRGGKLIGFGSSQTGNSGSYDRHVWMLNDGRLRFGTWTGQTNIAESNASYNDDQWHHLVATQSSAGMRLYVDGEVVGTNPQTSAQDYSGYWRVGGDTHWGDADSQWFAGSVDEVAIYSSALSAETVHDHYVKGGGRVPNVKPTASFDSTVSKLKASFDASASSDSDGTVASYAWDFGDTKTGTGAKPEHTYDAAGTYAVTLTVTDDDGATDSVTKQVVTVANATPTARFDSTVSKRTVTFDGSTSSDSDGTVASYAWDFGDTKTGTGAKPEHTYDAAGTYAVTLTVTDEDGATDSVTKQVVTVANARPTARFDSTVSGLKVSLDGSGSTDSDGTVASYAWSFGDTKTGTGAKPEHTYDAAGTYDVTLTVTDDDGATDAVTKQVTVTAPPVSSTVAADAFGRTESNGWGSAATGGAWTRSGTASNFAVGGGVGTMRMTAAGQGPRMTLTGVSARDVDGVVDLSLDKDPSGGGGFFSLATRVQGTSDYRAKLKVTSTGTLALSVVRTINGAETILQTVNLPTTTRLLAGETVRIRLQTIGNGSTTVRARVWKPGTTEPTTWQVSATDTTAALQNAGGTALISYISGSSTNTPITASWDNLEVVQAG